MDEVVDGTLGTVKVGFGKIMDGTLDSTNKLVVDSTGALSNNQTRIGSNTISTGTGASGTGTQRVATSTDSTIGTLTGGGVASAATDSGNPVKTGGKYNATAPTFTDGQRGDTQINASGYARTELSALVFPASTNNSSTAQLAASATFTGTIETVQNLQAAQVQIFSDQPVTINIDQFIDSGGTKLTSTDTFTRLANVPFNENVTLPGNYFRLRVQNTGASTTTTLQIDTTFGIMATGPRTVTALGNNRNAINELNGTAIDTNSGNKSAGTQRVVIATDQPTMTNAQPKIITTATATADTTMQNAVSATANGTSLTVTGYGTAMLQITGTFTATVTFEASMDAGTNWISISATQLGADIVTSTTTTGMYRITCAGADLIRARVTWTSGTSVTVVGRATNAIHAGKLIKLATGANTIGALTANQSVNIAQIAGGTAINSGVTGAMAAGGDTASAATDAGNPVKIGGKYNTTMPTYTDGQRGNVEITTRGAIKATLFGTDSATAIASLADNADGVAVTANLNSNKATSRNTVYNGTSWDRMPGDTVGVFVKQATATNLKAQVVAGDATGAAVPANAYYRGSLAQTALPAAATAGNLTGVLADKFGRQVVLAGTIRDLIGSQRTTISASTTETTIVTAIASTFNDIFLLSIRNTSATAVRVDIRDTTAGTIIDDIYVPAGETRGWNTGGIPVPQTTVNTNWTAQCSASVTDVRITAWFAKNK